MTLDAQYLIVEKEGEPDLKIPISELYELIKFVRELRSAINILADNEAFDEET